MPVVAVFQHPTLTRATYEASIRELTGGQATVNQPSDWPVPGLLVHVAGESPSGFRVVDVWASDEAFQKFGDVLKPIMVKLGIGGGPEVYPADAVVTA